MKFAAFNMPARSGREHGSVLVLVLWISFGMVVLSLYFAQSMTYELRAADNRVAGLEAAHALDGAARYVIEMLSREGTNGTVPDISRYQSEAVPVGDATFWLLGRGDEQVTPDFPVFGLADEASKINLNTAPVSVLQWLPRMTPELAAAIVDWRDTNSDVDQNGGAEDETYARLTPARRCKNAPFESVDELRLVYGMELEILFGEDTNRNGVLDPNENDGDTSPPSDNRDGRLDPGIVEYVTVYSREPNTKSDGTPRTNIGTSQGRQQVSGLLRQAGIEQRRIQEITTALNRYQTATFRSTLEFYIRSGMTADEFALIEDGITASNNPVIDGLINVNTASETVLACLPGIGTSNAPSVVAYRTANRGQTPSIAWLKEAMSAEDAVQAGRYLGARSYQFTADVAALGHQQRGYQRAKFVIDAGEGTPKILYRQDLTHLGWALGAQVRSDIQLAKQTRR